MRRKAVNIVICLIFLAGLGILVYPLVSNQWNTYRQNRLISEYEEVVGEHISEEDFAVAWAQAQAFNDSFADNNIYGDIFGTQAGAEAEETDREDGTGQDAEAEVPESDAETGNFPSYWQVLNIAGDGVMGYITIPKIEVRLVICHGAAEEVLQSGAGHLPGTKLPIGGEGTHSVLAAHRGLPSAKLFTDIDQLEAGDVFYIKVLDETLAYEVDRILPMVDKDDAETLKEALQVQPGEDYVTLFTCTPYGVNSHRLLVRGSRVPYNGALEERPTPVQSMVRAVKDYYMLYILLGLAITGLAAAVFRGIFRRGRGAGNTETEGGS